MSKEGLILPLLKSKRSLAELFNNNRDNDKIGEIIYPNKLRDNLTKEYRKKFWKKPYETENKKNLSKVEEEINEYLIELKRILNKEKHHYHDRDDPDYYGIRETKNLFSEVDKKDHYKLVLAESFLKGNYKYYESRGDRNENLSVKQYLHMTRSFGGRHLVCACV